MSPNWGDPRTVRFADEVRRLRNLEAGATHVLLTNAAPIAGMPDLGPELMAALKAAER